MHANNPVMVVSGMYETSSTSPAVPMTSMMMPVVALISTEQATTVSIAVYARSFAASPPVASDPCTSTLSRMYAANVSICGTASHPMATTCGLKLLPTVTASCATSSPKRPDLINASMTPGSSPAAMTGCEDSTLVNKAAKEVASAIISKPVMSPATTCFKLPRSASTTLRFSIVTSMGVAVAHIGHACKGRSVRSMRSAGGRR